METIKIELRAIRSLMTLFRKGQNLKIVSEACKQATAKWKVNDLDIEVTRSTGAPMQSREFQLISAERSRGFLTCASSPNLKKLVLPTMFSKLCGKQKPETTQKVVI